MLKWMIKEDDFTIQIKAELIKNKDLLSKETYWPEDSQRNRLLRKYNLRHGKNDPTLYSTEGYLAQLVPALEMTYALRHILGIKGGEGRIWNADESLTSRYEVKKGGWGV